MKADLVITTDCKGNCIAVTRQDNEGRITKVLWTSPTYAEIQRNIKEHKLITCTRYIGE